MKSRLFFVLIFMLSFCAFSLLNAQVRTVYLDYNFTGATSFPPTGWSVDSNAANWSLSQTNNAGGTAPEAKFSKNPQFFGQITRLVSPVIDLTGVTGVVLNFRFSTVHGTGGFAIGAASRHNNGDWNDLWNTSPTASITDQQVSLYINNADVNTSTFQFSVYFSAFNSYGIENLYLDDFKLESPLALDASVEDVIVSNENLVGLSFQPQAIAKNRSATHQTIPVVCRIYQYDDIVYSDSVFLSLDTYATEYISFNPFTPSVPNELYKVSVTTELPGDMVAENDRQEVWFDTYLTMKERVVLEVATGTWCQYCPGAAMGVNDLVQNGRGLVVLENHSGDSFANDYSNARNTYYDVSGYPTAIFDGMYRIVGGSDTESLYPYYLPVYNACINKRSPFKVTITGTQSGSTLNLNVGAYKLARYFDQPLVLHFAVTESNIAYPWENQEEVDYVNRLMLPDANGTALHFETEPTEIIPMTVNLNSAWVQSNLVFSAFIQNPDTKEIFQSSSVTLSTLLADIQILPPVAFSAQVNLDQSVILGWQTPVPWFGLYSYKIFRDNQVIAQIATSNFPSYVDRPGPGEHTYYVTGVFVTGESVPSNSVTVETVGNNDPSATPYITTLEGNYPNPFNPETKIAYTLAHPSTVELSIYNIKGQKIRNLVDTTMDAGRHTVTWNGTDDHGNGVASGVYFYRLNTDQKTFIKKAMLLK